MGYTYEFSDKLYIIPQNERTRISLLNVDRATKETLMLRHRIVIHSDWECNTIANVCIETLFRSLYDGLLGTTVTSSSEDASLITKAKLSFFRLFDVIVTEKRNDDADKVGNINISFTPGDRGLEIIQEDGRPVEEYISPEAAYINPASSAMNDFFLKVDKKCRYTLMQKHQILQSNEWISIAIAYTFIENLFRELMRELTLGESKMVAINFNDNIEFKATKKDSGCVIKIRPGMASKLNIKSDETTEGNDEYTDDFE